MSVASQANRTPANCVSDVEEGPEEVLETEGEDTHVKGVMARDKNITKPTVHLAVLQRQGQPALDSQVSFADQILQQAAVMQERARGRRSRVIANRDQTKHCFGESSVPGTSHQPLVRNPTIQVHSTPTEAKQVKKPSLATKRVLKELEQIATVLAKDKHKKLQRN